MATFNAMPAMQSGANAGDAMGMTAGQMPGNGLGMEAFPPDMNFDDSMLEGVNDGMPPIPPFHPSYDFETFSTTFEDPFNYARPYEAAPAHQDLHDEGSSPQQPDDKLLGFSATNLKATPIDDTTGGFSELHMSAELYGMFFVAEDVFGGDTAGRPLELTCYRRNLWQCSGQITMPRHCTQVMNEQGRAIPITEFYAAITGLESIEGKTTEIISIPWKSSNHPAGLGEGQETRVAGAPAKVALDLAAGGHDVGDGHRVTLPVSWKRLQFKSATANNGRRKGLQQHYLVQISLLGRMKASGDLMKIADIQSGPVIVRGRSPRNFDSKKDVPVSGDSNKKTTPQPAAAPPAEPQGRAGSDTPHHPDVKSERLEVHQNLPRYQSMAGAVHSQPSPAEWSSGLTPPAPAQHSAKRTALSPGGSSNSNGRPPVPTWGRESSTTGRGGKDTSSSSRAHAHHSRMPSGATSSSIPINLSLSEDERSSPNNTSNYNSNGNRSTSESLQSPKLHRTGSAHGSGGARVGSPAEEPDMLYEYFPLSVDDWTPLVDTVYRPHIVHHIAVPQEIQAQAIRSKSKRYFSAE